MSLARWHGLAVQFMVLAMAAWGAMAAVGRAQTPKELATIEGITEYQLSNGMQLLLYPDSSQPRVTVNLTVFVGSRHEGYGEAGMAHLLEHMLFKGTPTHANIPKLLQDRGAFFNGTTSDDRTNYYETLPASDDNLEFAIRLEADRMVNSLIRGEDLATEMTVVRNEFEAGENEPAAILMQRMTAVAFEWHNYGKSTIGNRSDIERVPIPNLREFYRRYYQPDNAMVVVAGQFDRAKALALAQQYFGSIARPERELNKTYTEEPPQDGERSVILRRVGDVGIVGAAYHIPAGPHPEYAAVEVLSYVLATEPAGRLYKSLVETKKATGVQGGSLAMHDPGLLFMTAQVRAENSLEEVRELMLAEMEKIGADGVSVEEVDRVKQEILKQRELTMANSARVAIGLSDWASQGDWRLFFLHRDRIEKVTADDVRDVAAKYLARTNRTVGMFIPSDTRQRSPVPSTPDVGEMVARYTGREAIASGEQFEPSPENIERRTTRAKLDSGLKVAFLPKKSRGEMVELAMTLRFGNVENLRGRNAACELLGTLMMRGTKRHTHQEIEDRLNELRAQLVMASSPGTLNVTLKVKRQQLAPTLELLRELLREPTLPEAEFELLRNERIAALEEQRSDPQSLARRRMTQTTNPYAKDDLRRTPTVEEELARFRDVTPAEIRELYQKFLGAEHGEAAVVGDFDANQVRSALEAIAESWTAEKQYARVAQEFFQDVKAGTQQIETPDKANAVYFAGVTMGLKDSDPDYAAMVIGNYILGGGSLSSRLGDRVRQKEGLSYGIGSIFSASALDSYGRIGIFAISNPDNAPKVAAAINEEIQKLLKQGITVDELEKAAKGHLESEILRRSNDAALCRLLGDSLYVDRTMKYHADLESQIRRLTPDEVIEALRRNLDPKRLVVIQAGDFKK